MSSNVGLPSATLSRIGAPQLAQDDRPGFRDLVSFTTCLAVALLVVQCSLLHPFFTHSRLARVVRISLTPINFVWFFTLPLRYSFTPRVNDDPMVNMAMASLAVAMSIKSLEWGFAKGPVYLRPLKTVTGGPRWDKFKEEDQLCRKQQEEEPFNALNLGLWTLLHLTS